MSRYEDIRVLHLEVTTRCNAACPMCARNVLGGRDNPHLPLVDLGCEDLAQALRRDGFIDQLGRVYLCGNYGDPINHRDLLDMVSSLKGGRTLPVGIHTNGSARDLAFWRELARLLPDDQDYCTFGIDGLNEVNAMYRRGTDFGRIMRNAEAFIRGGGHAHWEFIAFRHNEHQIEAARDRARAMGFERFTVKRTSRFFGTERGSSKDVQRVENRDGSFAYLIEKPTNPAFQNTALAHEADLIAKHGSMTAYFDATPISCKTVGDRSIYITAEGFVFPCCWTAGQMYSWHQPNRTAPIWRHVDNAGGTEAISMHHHAIAEIVRGPFFASIKDSWTKTACADGKLKVCAKTCGRDFDPTGSQA